MTDKQRIEQQTEAEFAFAQGLETQGVDPAQFMERWGLSLHQFNVLAHYVYEVADEDPALPPVLSALLHVLRGPGTVFAPAGR